MGTGPLDQVAIDILSPVAKIEVAPEGTEEVLLSLLENTVGLVVRGDGVATSKVIEAAKDLRVIGRTGVGCQNVDIAAATARRIPVVYVPGAGARAVAEAAITFMLALCKNMAHWDRELKTGNWKSRFESKPGDLEGAILGIVGFGRIGQLLAELALSFRMSVVTYDPYASAQRAAELKVKVLGFEELLRCSDFVSLHAPLTDETRGLIDRERLRLMKPGSYLINLARGGLITNLDILYEALKDGRLAGVGLDVFDPEPPDVSHPIFRLPNCLVSPHAMGMTHRAMFEIFKTMAEDMVAVLTGSRPRFVVNPESFAQAKPSSVDATN